MKFVYKSFLVFTFFIFGFYSKVSSQAPSLKIAVFAPVYVDSAFDGNNYKLGNGNLPKNILAGLDFYNGVMLAVDSLQAEGINAEVLFFDLKSTEQTLKNIIQKDAINNVSLIIASFNSITDIKPLSDFAASKKIPLISSTFPNNGGIINNPYFTVINPTLKTHCEELYKFLQRSYSTNTVLFFKRKGAVENFILTAFSDMARSTPAIPLKIKTIELSDTFNTKQLAAYLDSTRKNILVCGSLNEAFSIRLVKSLSTISSTYKSTVIGMPNWDGLKDLDKPDCKGVDIIYSTPYNFSKTDKNIIALTNKYRNIFNGRPSDMVFKGFESMYHFTKIVEEHGSESIHFLSEKKFKLFNDFDIRSVINKNNRLQTDYVENKKLYFIKKSEGLIKSVL
jgi:hypothetical protein